MGCCGDSTEPERVNGKIPGYGDGEDFEGPMKKRGCTDILCLLIFLAYVVGMIVVFGMAVQHNGNPYRLLYGYDVKGDTCGQENPKLAIYPGSGEDLSSKKYLYFDATRTALMVLSENDFNKFQTSSSTSLSRPKNVADKIGYCLNGDVTLTTTSNDGTNSNTQANSSVIEDLDKKLLDFMSVEKLLNGGGVVCRKCVDNCPNDYTSLFHRCISDWAKNSTQSFYESSGAKSYFEEVVGDVSSSWKEIIYMCLVALGLSIVVTILFRFLAGVIVYTIIIGVALAAILATLISWLVWYFKKKDYEEQTGNRTGSAIENTAYDQAKQEIQNSTVISTWTQASSEKEVQNFLIIAIVVTIATVIILLILLVLRKRIKLVVQLFKEAGKAVHSMPLILLQPLMTFVALVILSGIWTIALAFIETAGEPRTNSETGYVEFTKDSFWFWIRVYHLFGLLWLANFFVACQHMVIAGAVAGWYFARDKSKLNFPIVSSFKRLVLYHLGSVAFGSFIIALIQLIRMIMAYIERKLKKRGGAAGSILTPVLKVCQCCLWCFEKCMKFLNKNAYIEVAIYGYNFCKAAQKAFSLLTNNILRVAAINSVGTFVLFLGKLAVVASTVVCGIQIMNTQKEEDKVKNAWAPIFLAAIFSYMTVDCFIGVYGMAIDTIFLCFCEDSERNDGISKPYYMSKGLMEFVENSTKALEALKQRQTTNYSNAPNVMMVVPGQKMSNQNDGMPLVE